MRNKFLLAGTIFLLTATLAMAADAITGKWRMEQEGFNGGPTRVSTLDLKADGATLTGSITQPGMGGDASPTTTPISNGKVDGNKATFDVTRDFNGNSFTIKYACEVNGADMKITVTLPGFQGGDSRTMEATAKKQ